MDIRIRLVTTHQDDPKPLICIDGPDFQYSRLVGLYSAQDGVGLQVCEGMSEEYYMEICNRLSKVVRQLYLDRLPKESTI